MEGNGIVIKANANKGSVLVKLDDGQKKEFPVEEVDEKSDDAEI